MLRLVFPGITHFIDRIAKANGKPHARNRIDGLRPLKDLGDIAGGIAHRIAQVGEIDHGVNDALRVMDERVNDLLIAHATAEAIRDHVRSSLGLDKSTSKPAEPATDAEPETSTALKSTRANKR